MLLLLFWSAGLKLQYVTLINNTSFLNIFVAVTRSSQYNMRQPVKKLF